MGADPTSSVLNPQCQAHDVRNLFVVDGGPFVTNPHKNVTWTILALSWRAGDFISGEMKRGNL
jgi:choline dehydrogenase-like flavoprotein